MKSFAAVIMAAVHGLRRRTNTVASRYPFLIQKQDPAVDVAALAGMIAAAQEAQGAIAWWPGHKTDPWDHVESAMGLTTGGLYGAARKAFTWLRDHQLPDGSWYAAYIQDQPTELTRETNHAAYIAAGLYHYYLVTGDAAFIAAMWPTLEKAIGFAIRYQAPSGEIYWALDPEGRVDRMALLTGCSSICFSLKCALALAKLVDRRPAAWRLALERLQACIIHRPHRFNMTKARFSMDWFYPILCGVVQDRQAHDRLDRSWKKFVIPTMGVRCVSDQPWVTIAESCELVIALTAMDHLLPAHLLFSWIADRTFADHTFWCGFTCPDLVRWPEEKYTWTNAAALMAADALYGLTPAAHLFRHARWRDLLAG